MIDWKRKLCSRKLWVAIIGFITGVLTLLGYPESTTVQIGALILQAASITAYIIGEGLADASPYDYPSYSEGESTDDE